MHGFTPEQVQWLLSLIETQKSGFEKLLGKKAWLFVTHAVKRGSVKLSPKLMLHDVLYVPSLDCNLIYVAMLYDNIY